MQEISGLRWQLTLIIYGLPTVALRRQNNQQGKNVEQDD